MALEGWRSVCSSAHLPCSPLSGPGSLVCSHWLCGLSIRSHCSSSHRTRLHSHLCRHTDSLQKCSAHWSTWRRSRCTSFLKRTKDGCHWYKTLGFLSSALDVVVDTLIALRKSPLALCFPSRIWSYQFPWRGGARWWHWWREPSWEPNGSLTCRETFEVQRQFVRAVGTVGVAVTLPLRAEKTATIPTAKLLWSTGAVHWKKRATFSLGGMQLQKTVTIQHMYMQNKRDGTNQPISMHNTAAAALTNSSEKHILSAFHDKFKPQMQSPSNWDRANEIPN